MPHSSRIIESVMSTSQKGQLGEFMTHIAEGRVSSSQLHPMVCWVLDQGGTEACTEIDKKPRLKAKECDACPLPEKFQEWLSSRSGEIGVDATSRVTDGIVLIAIGNAE